MDKKKVTVLTSETIQCWELAPKEFLISGYKIQGSGRRNNGTLCDDSRND